MRMKKWLRESAARAEERRSKNPKDHYTEHARKRTQRWIKNKFFKVLSESVGEPTMKPPEHIAEKMRHLRAKGTNV